MSEIKLTEKELRDICEDCFVTVKEACMQLQERTQCSDQVVIEMLKNVTEFYISKNSK